MRALSFERYCNIIYSENPLYRFDHSSVGDEIKFGKYNFEDIAWNVIEANENKVVLLSKYIIDAGSFPEESWMTTFSEKAFTDAEKTIVENEKTIENKKQESNELLTEYYTTNEKERIKQFIYDNCIYGIDMV